YTWASAAPWCSGLTCLPVTEEIGGSNPLGVAIQNKFRTGLGEFNKPLKRIIKSPSPGLRVLVDGHAGEQQFCEFSPPFRRSAPVPDRLECALGARRGLPLG